MLLYIDTHIIEFESFMLLLIMRLGRTSRDQLKRISSIFHYIDSDNKGYVMYDDICTPPLNTIEMVELHTEEEENMDSHT